MAMTDSELLEKFSRYRSDEAFGILVNRHLNLVYTAALRQVGSSQLAEDVAQSVFIDLSRNAGKLKEGTILSAWLYNVTRRTAIDVVRSESRRQIREQAAVDLAAMTSPDPHWDEIQPLLDEGMESLDEQDRSSVLLRYFENKSLREVGQALGTSDDAAQKRVSRAVERLREFLAKRGVAIGASGFVAVLSANTVQAAPLGLSTTITSASVVAGKAIAVAATKTIVMTTLQKTLITTALLVAVGVEIYQARETAQLRQQVRTLQQQQAPLNERVQQMSSEREAATLELVALRLENQRLLGNVAELPKLRGEVTGKSRELARLKTASKESNEVPIKNLLAFSTDQSKRQGTNSAFARVEELKRKLHLTPEQEKGMRDILSRNVDPESELDTARLTGTLSDDEWKKQWANLQTATEAGIQELLTPDQQGLYAQLKTDETKKSSNSFAKNEAAVMQRELQLSPDQVQAATRILSGLRPGRGGQGNAADADAKEQLELRLQALKPVLTPQQLESYRQNKLQALAQAEMAFKLFRSVTP